MNKHPDCEDRCQILEHKGYHTCSQTGRCEQLEAMTAERTPIYYDDECGIHACEGGYAATPKASPFLVWTLCEKNVPANQGYRTDSPQPITCEDCLQVIQDNSQFGAGA